MKHNAGHMVNGPTEAFTPEEMARVYDTNVLGTQRLNRAALPQLRKQGHGLVLWVGSSSTRGGTPPYLAPYFAAKAAMDALAVSYAAELARFGIETTIVVPGSFTSGTEHFANAGQPADEKTAAEYDALYGGMLESVAGRLAEQAPEDADACQAFDEIARIVALPDGTQPHRPGPRRLGGGERDRRPHPRRVPHQDRPRRSPAPCHTEVTTDGVGTAVSAPSTRRIHGRTSGPPAVETTSYSVEEVGFGSPRSFRDVFRSLVGTSPRDYRRTFRGSPAR